MTIAQRESAQAPTILRMHRIVMASAILAIAPLSVIGVALTTASWWEALFIALTLVFATTLLKEWSLDGYTPRAVFLLVFTGAGYLYGAVMANSPISFMPFALVGAMLLMRVRRHRVRAGILFAGGVTALGAVSLVTNPITATLVITFVLIPAVGTLYISAVVFAGESAWKLVLEAERAKEIEAALAVAEERARLAGDLHDIQGQSLHVIKLKAALAQRLLRADPPRATAELAQIRELVDDTVAKTRELTYARYEIDLTAELANTRALAEASGMRVTIRQELDRSADPHPLLAHTLREATTNLLRHAEPTWVTITASAEGVEIANDGAPVGGGVRPRGLARLHERIADAGGELSFAQDGDVFTIGARLTAGAVPAPAATVSRTEGTR